MKKEMKYPCYMKNKSSGLKVLFIERKKCYVQEANYSFKADEVIENIDSDNGYWKPYEPSRFKDGVVVLCWDDESFVPSIRRWDAINDSVCWSDGARDGNEYDNYKLFEGKLPFVLPKIKD